MRRRRFGQTDHSNIDISSVVDRYLFIETNKRKKPDKSKTTSRQFEFEIPNTGFERFWESPAGKHFDDDEKEFSPRNKRIFI